MCELNGLSRASLQLRKARIANIGIFSAQHPRSVLRQRHAVRHTMPARPVPSSKRPHRAKQQSEVQDRIGAGRSKEERASSSPRIGTRPPASSRADGRFRIARAGRAGRHSTAGNGPSASDQARQRWSDSLIRGDDTQLEIGRRGSGDPTVGFHTGFLLHQCAATSSAHADRVSETSGGLRRPPENWRHRG